MAFYDLGSDTNLDTSWLDEFDSGPEYKYDYRYEMPEFDLSELRLQDWQPQTESQFSFTAPELPPIPTNELPARFQPELAPEFVDPGTYMGSYETQPQQQVNPVTGAIISAGKGAADWVLRNPKDVLGAAVGAGMGIYGLASRGGEVPKPDLSQLAAARAALQAQAGKSAQYNDPVYQAAMRNMQRELDQPGGYDPRLAEERKQLRAQREAYYQSRGLLGSDIANRELADFDRQTTSLLEDDAARRSQTRMGTYNIAAGAASPEQTTRTFSNLANLGIQGAQTEQAAATSNAQLMEARRNQLLKTGGDIFGRSIATDPFEEERKRKNRGTLAGT